MSLAAYNSRKQPVDKVYLRQGHRTHSAFVHFLICVTLLSAYLAKLDKYVETELLPVYNRGARRKFNNAYEKVRHRAHYLAKRGRHKEAAALRKLCRTIPSIDPQDPEYRRLRYLRYADDVRHFTQC